MHQERRSKFLSGPRGSRYACLLMNRAAQLHLWNRVRRRSAPPFPGLRGWMDGWIIDRQAPHTPKKKKTCRIRGEVALLERGRAALPPSSRWSCVWVWCLRDLRSPCRTEIMRDPWGLELHPVLRAHPLSPLGGVHTHTPTFTCKLQHALQQLQLS